MLTRRGAPRVVVAVPNRNVNVSSISVMNLINDVHLRNSFSGDLVRIRITIPPTTIARAITFQIKSYIRTFST